MSPDRKHPSSLWDGFWGVHLLHVGQSLGLFAIFSEPVNPTEAAARMQLETRYLEVWCRAAAACGLLECRGDSYLTPVPLREWLQQSQGFTHSHLNLWQRLQETFQAVLTGRALPEPPISMRVILAEGLLQNYRWVFEQVPGDIPAFAHALANARRVLEVGCGMGLGLGVLRTNYPQLELYGLEADFDCAREAERASRAVIHLGELPGDRFGKAFDLVVCFRALATAKRPETLLQECSKLLSPGGWLVLGTELQDRDGLRKSSTRSLGELFAYQLLAGETEINVFTSEQLEEMLDGFGLKVEATVEAPDWGTPLYLCSRRSNSETT